MAADFLNPPAMLTSEGTSGFQALTLHLTDSNTNIYSTVQKT